MGSSRKASRLLVLAREIVRREQELGRLRAEFARLAGDDPQLELPLTPSGTEETQQVVASLRATRPSLVKGSTLALRIVSLLELNTRPLTAPEIQTLLESSDPIDTIRTTLSKLVARGAIERIGPGTYRSCSSDPDAREGGKRTA